MWWNHAGWESMHGWWFMPVFALFCMFIFLIILSYVFKHSGRGCGPFRQGALPGNQRDSELLDEIKALRRDVDELRKNQKEMS